MGGVSPIMIIIPIILSHEEETALYAACSGGHLDIVKELLAHPDIDINAKNGRMILQLLLAADIGNVTLEDNVVIASRICTMLVCHPSQLLDGNNAIQSEWIQKISFALAPRKSARNTMQKEPSLCGKRETSPSNEPPTKVQRNKQKHPSSISESSERSN